MMPLVHCTQGGQKEAHIGIHVYTYMQAELSTTVPLDLGDILPLKFDL